MEQGRTERSIIKQCVRERRPPEKWPVSIRNAPQLIMGLELFFEAFMELHTCRGGMNDGPIPWTAIDQYCRRHGFGDDLSEDVLYYVRAVDDAWLDHAAKKRESEKNRGKTVRKSRK